MAKGADWDWGSTSSLQAAAPWLLKKAGPDALFVCFVRVNDFAIAGDPALLPREVLNLFEDRLPELQAALEAQRVERMAKAERDRARELKRAS